MEPVPVSAGTRERLREMVDEATLYGAKVLVNGLGSAGVMGATLLTDVTPEMRIAQADVFAPVVSVLRVESVEAGIAAHHACAYGLTAAVFGPVREAEALGSRLRAGCVLINDLIVPTADPRAGFGGRGESGFGVTRGREGLLAMTAVKTVLRQRWRSRSAYGATGTGHVGLFAGLALALHGGGWRERLRGVRMVIGAGRRIG
jgi:aldehyde dehydrogenase (NAD+)